MVSLSILWNQILFLRYSNFFFPIFLFSLGLKGSFDASVRVWDIKSQQRHPIQIFQDAKDSITCIILSGNEFITGSVDGYVRSYDVRMGQVMEDYFEGCSFFIIISQH